MPLNKPFKRIFRDMISGNPDDYIKDTNYSPDRFSFVHSYHLIEKDIKELFDYVSPNDENKTTFSHRIYELFFRCCTEFENNAVAILNSNGYKSSSNNMNIKNDYFKINKALKIDKYQARLNIWEDNPLILKPFSNWNSITYVPLSWYSDYNSVKHNRSQNFKLANLENLINAAAGLLIVLYAQYEYNSFSPYQTLGLIDDEGFFATEGSIFQIKPHQWQDSEKYDFDWNTIKNTIPSMNNFQF